MQHVSNVLSMPHIRLFGHRSPCGSMYGQFEKMGPAPGSFEILKRVSRSKEAMALGLQPCTLRDVAVRTRETRPRGVNFFHALSVEPGRPRWWPAGTPRSGPRRPRASFLGVVPAAPKHPARPSRVPGDGDASRFPPRIGRRTRFSEDTLGYELCAPL